MKIKSNLTFLFLILVAMSCKQESIEVTTTDPVPNPYPTGGVSLLPDPGLNNPRMRFHDGTVENYAPKLYKEVPNIPNLPVSDWYVTQWKKNDLLHPLKMTTNPTEIVDSLFGNPLYHFPTDTNVSHVSVFFDQNKGKYVYELYSEHGWLDTMGGTNVFISAPILPNVETTLDKRIDLNFNAKIKSRETKYEASKSDRDGSVVSQFFGGFTLYYNDPNSNEKYSVFMQIAYADSRNPKFLAPNKLEYRGCYKNDFGDKQIVYGNNAPNSLGGNGFIANPQPNEELTSYSYSINRQICNMIAKDFNCNDGTVHSFSEAAKQLKNWKVTGFYTGLETQDAFALNNDVSPTVPGPQRGIASLGVMLSDLKLMRYPEEQILNCDSLLNPTKPSPQKCIPNSQISCEVDNGQGVQTCDQNGQAYSACSIKSCLEDFTNNGDQCVPSTSSVSVGQFCSDGYFTKWQCGSKTSPGTSWSKVSDDCYHKKTTNECK